MLRYDNAMELRRRPWQRRIEVYSPKIQRRLTLFSRDAHDAWLLLEADPDTLTEHTIAEGATWADKYRDSNANGARHATRQWHFVDIERTDATKVRT